MKRKILLPTDFSKNSIKAINYARELFKNDLCNFYLLNVFSATGNVMKGLMSMEPGSNVFETAKQDSENGLAMVIDMITMSDNYNPKHQFEVISTYNSIVEAINTTVAQKDIEMIVMGTKGESNSKTTSFGSTAVYVMEKVRNCPIIVVPHKAKLALPKEIVFPTDYKIPFKSRELSHLINIAKSCDATIIVLHILERDELDKQQIENKKLLEEILKGTKYSFSNLSDNSVMSAVNIFVESRNSDMVAFINKKHTFFGSILTNPMVKEITFQLNVPILAMHDLRN